MQCKIAKKNRLRRARCLLQEKHQFFRGRRKKSLHMENHEKKTLETTDRGRVRNENPENLPLSLSFSIFSSETSDLQKCHI